MSTAKKLIAATSGVGGAGENIEDVYATYIYTGTGSSQTITNNIDLAGEGGLVWFKRRNGSHEHGLYDTARGTGKRLMSDQNGPQETDNNGLSAFTSTGFTVISADDCNGNSDTYASWTFRKAKKFFDIVTYTGDGTSGRVLSHNLGSVPGMIIIKSLDTNTAHWEVYHRSLGIATGDYPYILQWNRDVAQIDNQTYFASGITATQFKISHYNATNQNGTGYVAYLWAHNNSDGGYGPSGDQDIIKCNSYTGNGSTTNTINVGFEPQWVMIKNATSSADWIMFDITRGWVSEDGTGGPGDEYLFPNQTQQAADAELIEVHSNGFRLKADNTTTNTNGATYIYMAIRRGPMADPTAATQVFYPHAYTTSDGSWQDRTLQSGFPTDLAINGYRNITDGGTHSFVDRIRGYSALVRSHQVTAESERTGDYNKWPQTGQAVTSNEWSKYNGGAGLNYYNYQFRRAPGFFDIVAYNGDGGSSQTITHNLGAIPQVVLGKRRDSTSDWVVYYGNGLYNVFFNEDASKTGLLAIHETGSAGSAITSKTQFDVRSQSGGNASKSLNTSSAQYLLYIFGNIDGISKFGTYTGTGSQLDVDCGFSSGARFVTIKCLDSTGDWYFFDTARGIDNYMKWNSTAADVSADYIDIINSGFRVKTTGGSATNANGDNYVFFAIA